MLIKSDIAKHEALSETNKNGKRCNEVQGVHGLRKFFATQLENAGVDDFDNEELLGHVLGLGTYRKTPEKRLKEYLTAGLFDVE